MVNKLWTPKKRVWFQKNNDSNLGEQLPFPSNEKTNPMALDDKRESINKRMIKTAFGGA